MKQDLLRVISSVDRPVLGEEIPILIFRAFRLYSGEYLKEIVGDKGASMLFLNAGRQLGLSLARNLLDEDVNRFLERVSDFAKEEKLGLLVVEDLNEEKAVLRLDECITCSGMPNIGMRICHFETGIVAGLFEAFLGKRVKATETKCNAMGEGTCQVTVEL